MPRHVYAKVIFVDKSSKLRRRKERKHLEFTSFFSILLEAFEASLISSNIVLPNSIGVVAAAAVAVFVGLQKTASQLDDRDFQGCL